MSLDDARALLHHMEWADVATWSAVLDHGEEDEELRAKLHHLHAVQWVYLHLWRGERVRPREAGAFPTLRAMRGWAREYYRELPAFLVALPPDALATPVVFPWTDDLVQRFGAVRPVTWADSVVQVAMHSSYHRGQLARRLRERGAAAPLTDYVAWLWAGRPGADWGEDEAA